MDKKLCDICSKEIKDYLNGNKIIFQKSQKYKFEEELNELEDEKPKDLDICFICMRKLKIIIEQMKEEEKIKQQEMKEI